MHHPVSVLSFFVFNKQKQNRLFLVSNNIHLALARDGLIEEQTAAILLVQAGVLRSRRAGSHTTQTGHTEGLEAVGREWRRRCRWVGLVTRGGPAPVAPWRAVAWWCEGASRTVVLPWTTQTFCRAERGEGEHQGEEKKVSMKGLQSHLQIIQPQQTCWSFSVNDGRSRHLIKFRQVYLHFTQKSLPALLLIVTQENKSYFFVPRFHWDVSKVFFFFFFRSKKTFLLNIGYKRHFTLWRLRLGKNSGVYMTTEVHISVYEKFQCVLR